MEFLVFILLITAGAAHIRIGSLQDRVELLEAGKKAPVHTQAVKEEVAVNKEAAKETAKESAMEKRAAALEPDSGPSPIFKWLSTDWPMKLGAFLILLAFAWLTSYAFINNWIGPMGRIVLGLVSGVLIMGLGEWRIKKYAGQGAVFLALGTATVLLSLYAARNVYDFFSPLTALLGMFIPVVWMGLSSLRHKNLALSITGLAMGALAPLLINSPVPDYFGLFSYLLVLTLGTLTVAYKSGWKVLTLLSFLVIFFYSGLAPITDSEKTIGLVFASTFIGLFYLSNVLSIWKTELSSGTEMAIAIGNGFLLLVWMDEMLPTDWESLAFAGMGIALLALTNVLYRSIKKQEKILYVYYVTAAVVLMGAALLQWQGAALTLALTWGAAALLALAVFTTKDPKLALKLSPLLLPALFCATPSYESSLWSRTLFLDLHFLSLLSLSAVLLGLSYFLHRNKNHHLVFFVIMALQSVAITLLTVQIFVLDAGARNLLFMAFIVPFMAILAQLFKDRTVSRLLPAMLLPALAMNMDSSGWPDGTIFHTHFAALLSFVLVTLGIGLLLRRYADKFALLYFILSGLYTMMLVWLSSDALIENPNLHITVSLGLYTLAGLYFNVHGALQGEKASRITGGLLIGFVVARLLLVDVWEMAIGAKVITFFIIGALLISTAFFNKKLSADHKK